MQRSLGASFTFCSTAVLLLCFAKVSGDRDLGGKVTDLESNTPETVEAAKKASIETHSPQLLNKANATEAARAAGEAPAKAIVVGATGHFTFGKRAARGARSGLLEQEGTRARPPPYTSNDLEYTAIGQWSEDKNHQSAQFKQELEAPDTGASAKAKKSMDGAIVYGNNMKHISKEHSNLESSLDKLRKIIKEKQQNVYHDTETVFNRATNDMDTLTSKEELQGLMDLGDQARSLESPTAIEAVEAAVKKASYEFDSKSTRIVLTWKGHQDIDLIVYRCGTEDVVAGQGGDLNIDTCTGFDNLEHRDHNEISGFTSGNMDGSLDPFFKYDSDDLGFKGEDHSEMISLTHPFIDPRDISKGRMKYPQGHYIALAEFFTATPYEHGSEGTIHRLPPLDEASSKVHYKAELVQYNENLWPKLGETGEEKVEEKQFGVEGDLHWPINMTVVKDKAFWNAWNAKLSEYQAEKGENIINEPVPLATEKRHELMKSKEKNQFLRKILFEWNIDEEGNAKLVAEGTHGKALTTRGGQ